jgi:hypothetical protein
MHGERYPDAPTAGAIVQQMGDRIRQLESGEELSRLRAENTALRESLRLTSEERGRLEIELRQHQRMTKRLASEERQLKGD